LSATTWIASRFAEPRSACPKALLTEARGWQILTP
jgi:hypothetical protein